MNARKFDNTLFSDPHVRIVGKNADVLKAKELVLTCLDSRVRNIVVVALYICVLEVY